jgi:hypothetical protein
MKRVKGVRTAKTDLSVSFDLCVELFRHFPSLSLSLSLFLFSILQVLTMADVSDPAIREAVASVRDDSSGLNWVAIGYTGKAELGVAGTGSGGHTELMNFLTLDKV